MKYGVIFALMLGFFSVSAQADSCFKVSFKDQTAARIDLSNRTEKWCVHKFEQDGANYELTYNVDKRVKPELSFLKRTGDEMVSFGSRSLGKIRWVVSDGSEFDPIPSHVSNSPRMAVAVKLNFDNKTKLARIKKLLLANFANKSAVRSYLRVRAGRTSSYLEKSQMPWRGYWWPTTKYEMARTQSSPMYIFDRVMEKLYPGKKTDAYNWERRHHSQRLGWGGHCNGWAAASTLNAEPTETLKDPLTGLLISPMVQKAWLTETHFCMNYAVYGTRYRDKSDDRKDISPATFHKVMIHYIKNLRKPVNMDIIHMVPVYNHVASGYSFTIKRRSSRRYRVEARIRMHAYDQKYTESLGTARTYTRLLKYDLITDKNGVVKSGRWKQKKHPDFLWVPVAQENCDSENPYVTSEAVTELLNLPKAVIAPTE